MKKIMVVEDEQKHRNEWSDFFKKYSKDLEAEVIIPEYSPGIVEKILRFVLEGGYIIMDNEIWKGGGSGRKIKIALETLGFKGKILMASESRLDGLINIGKPSPKYHQYIFKNIAALLEGMLQDWRWSSDEVTERLLCEGGLNEFNYQPEKEKEIVGKNKKVLELTKKVFGS